MNKHKVRPTWHGFCAFLSGEGTTTYSCRITGETVYLINSRRTFLDDALFPVLIAFMLSSHDVLSWPWYFSIGFALILGSLIEALSYILICSGFSQQIYESTQTIVYLNDKKTCCPKRGWKSLFVSSRGRFIILPCADGNGYACCHMNLGHCILQIVVAILAICLSFIFGYLIHSLWIGYVFMAVLAWLLPTVAVLFIPKKWCYLENDNAEKLFW